jgi:flagellar hook-basal body complex protein FliE
MQSISQLSNTLNAVSGAPSFGPGGGAAGAPFSGLLSAAVSNLNQLQQQAAATTEGLLTGRGVDIPQAMIATQKADTAFEMALAVRNKAVAAYQQVMNMQF